MKFVTGESKKLTTYQELTEMRRGMPITVHGAVHLLRNMDGLVFLTLRIARGAVQCV